VKSLDKILDTIMRCLMAITMFALVAGGTWQIFTRWILNDPSTFTEEFMRYTLIWAGMIGSAYCFYKDQHLSLDLVKNKTQGVAKVILNCFIEVCVLGFVGYVFIYGGLKLTLNSINASPVLHIPFHFLYSILPISGCFIVLARIAKYIQIFKDRGNAEKGGNQ
jgi:TRAP-type transport system small permease protein